MAKLFNTDDLMDYAAQTPAPRSPASLSETFGTAFDAATNRTSVAVPWALRDEYDKMIEDIEKNTGQRLENPYSVGRKSREEAIRRSREGEDLSRYGSTFGEVSRSIGVENFHKRVAELTRDYPELPIRTHEDIVASVTEARKEVEQARAEAAAGESGVLSSITSFAGGMAGAFTDPYNLMTLPLGASWSRGILQTALIEAGIQGTVEAAIQGAYQTTRSQVGEDPDWKEALESIALVAAGGGIIGAGAKGIGKGVSVLRARRAAVEVADQLPNKSPDLEAAIAVEKRSLDIEEANPYGPDKGGMKAHYERVKAAEDALVSGRALTEDSLPTGPANIDAIPLTTREHLERFLDILDAEPQNLEGAIRTLQELPEDVVRDTESLVQLVTRTGGIEATDPVARALGVSDEALPGVVAKGGNSLDTAIKLAEEAGFFPEGTPSRSDFVNLLKAEAEGGTPTFPRYYQALTQEQRTAGQTFNALEDAGVLMGALSPSEAAARVRWLRQSLRQAEGKGDASAVADTGSKNITDAEIATRTEARTLADEAENAVSQPETLDQIREAQLLRDFAGREDEALFRFEDEDGTVRKMSLRDVLEEDARLKDDIEALSLCIHGGLK